MLTPIQPLTGQSLTSLFPAISSPARLKNSTCANAAMVSFRWSAAALKPQLVATAYRYSAPLTPTMKPTQGELDVFRRSDPVKEVAIRVKNRRGSSGSPAFWDFDVDVSNVFRLRFARGSRRGSGRSFGRARQRLDAR